VSLLLFHFASALWVEQDEIICVDLCESVVNISSPSDKCFDTLSTRSGIGGFRIYVGDCRGTKCVPRNDNRIRGLLQHVPGIEEVGALADLEVQVRAGGVAG
jgi:hypothetical protein